jgi:hypothetical protein
MVMHFGLFTLDSDRRQVFRDGTVAHLTPKAFELLTSLVTAAQRVVSKREFARPAVAWHLCLGRDTRGPGEGTGLTISADSCAAALSRPIEAPSV